jgi:hypothetical protein
MQIKGLEQDAPLQVSTMTLEFEEAKDKAVRLRLRALHDPDVAPCRL